MKKQNHEHYSMDAAMAKLFAAEAASDVTRRRCPAVRRLRLHP